MYTVAPSFPHQVHQPVPFNFENQLLGNLNIPHEVKDYEAPTGMYLPSSSGGPLLLPKNVRTMAEWGAAVISFGKKHKGHSYREVMQMDPEYCQWLLGHCKGPHMEDFRDYINAFRRLQAASTAAAASASAAAARPKAKGKGRGRGPN